MWRCSARVMVRRVPARPWRCHACRMPVHVPLYVEVQRLLVVHVKKLGRFFNKKAG